MQPVRAQPFLLDNNQKIISSVKMGPIFNALEHNVVDDCLVQLAEFIELDA